MKNFPHQFNDLTKLYNSLAVVKELVRNQTPLTDDNFGRQDLKEKIDKFCFKS